MSIKSILRSTYGTGVTTLTTAYQRCLEKEARYRNHIVFNARCKRERVTPGSLPVDPPIDTLRGRKIAEQAGRQFVNERLRLANYKMRELEEERKWREIGLRRQLSEEDMTHVVKMGRANAEIVFQKTKERPRLKFEKIRQQQKTKVSTQIHDKKWVTNLSNYNLTEHEQKVLEKGLNFAVTPKHIPRREFIAGVEAALRRCRNIGEETTERTRATIASALRRARNPEPNLEKEEIQALATLRENNDIVILRADKGNETVILNAEDYEKRASDILDHPPFKLMKHDPTQRTEKRVNETLKKMVDTGNINKETARSLKVSPSGTRTPLFYGTVKTHKINHPLRPIVSSIGSPTYNIPKFVNSVLSPYVRDSPYFIENTQHFVEEISKLEIEDDEVMVSFDVKSLFTSVPVKDAVRAIRETLEAETMLQERTGVNTEGLMKLIDLCTSTTHFKFRNRHYQLTDGLPMGSPASQRIANIFMNKLEHTALQTFKKPPRVWHRYVDDVFSIVKKNLVQELLQHLNSQNPSIKFTVEVEKDNTLPYLDVAVHRTANKKLGTDVYRKPTHTGRYLNYASNHPDSAKRAVVRSLIDRTNYIKVEDHPCREAEERRIHNDLTMNGYPSSFIQKTIQKSRVSQQKGKTKGSDTTTTTTATIPYVRGLSETISRILTPLGIRTVMKPTTLKWTLMRRAKTSVPTTEIPGVIYALGCEDCPRIYIGETARTAKQRAREHKCHARTGHPELSAVARHAHDEAHSIHWTPMVLTKEKDTMKRKIKEALTIKRVEKERGKDRTLNQDTGLELSKIWLDLV